jgi:hypothetical protein
MKSESEVFQEQCLEFYTRITKIINECKYTDRQIAAVCSAIIVKICQRQDEPEKSFTSQLEVMKNEWEDMKNA